MIDIQRLRKLEQQLPGSVWYQTDELDYFERDLAPTRHVEGVERPDSADCETVRVGSFDNVEIAADVCEMRNALPVLLDEVERQRRRVADLERACRRSLDFVNYVGEHAPEVVGEWELAELLMLTLEATE